MGWVKIWTAAYIEELRLGISSKILVSMAVNGSPGLLWTRVPDAVRAADALIEELRPKEKPSPISEGRPEE